MNKMMYVFAAGVSMLFCGCVFNDQPNITYYSFAEPVTYADHVELQRPVTIAPIQLDATSKIRLRMPDGTIAYDDEKCWSQSPAILMREYLMRTLASMEPKKPTAKYLAMTPLCLDIEVFTFEYNMRTRRAEIGLSWVISDPAQKDAGKNKVTARSKVMLQSNPQAEDEIDPGKAMSEALESFVRVNLTGNR